MRFRPGAALVVPPPRCPVKQKERRKETKRGGKGRPATKGKIMAQTKIAIVLLAVALIAAACGGSSSETAPAPAETTRPPATAAEAPTATTTAGPSATVAATTAATVPAGPRDGDFEFRVTGIEEGVADDLWKPSEGNTFLRVTVAVKNISSGSNRFPETAQELLLNGEEARSRSSMHETGRGSIKAEETREVSLVWEVPAAWRTMNPQLEMHDGLFSDGVTFPLLADDAPPTAAQEGEAPAATEAEAAVPSAEFLDKEEALTLYINLVTENPDPDIGDPCELFVPTAWDYYKILPEFYPRAGEILAEAGCEIWPYLTDQEVNDVETWFDETLWDTTCAVGPNHRLIEARWPGLSEAEGRDWVFYRFVSRYQRAEIASYGGGLMECSWPTEDTRELIDMFQGRIPWRPMPTSGDGGNGTVATTVATEATTTTAPTTTVAPTTTTTVPLDDCYLALLEDIGFNGDLVQVGEANFNFPQGQRRCTETEFKSNLTALSEFLFLMDVKDDPCEWLDEVYYATPSNSRAEAWVMDALFECA